MTSSRRRYLWIVAFVSGMCVMALEMTASRLVAPYFGTSLFVWANVIGIILAALSFGYFIGGKWAERSPDVRTLLKILLVAAVLAALIPLLVAPFARFVITELVLASGAAFIVVGSFFTLIVLFAAPIFLMGMTSPFLIKLLTSDNRGAGETAGGVFALSTIGSLLGTFLPALWLVPSIGTRATVFLFSAILFVTVFFGLLGRRLGFLSFGVLLFLPYALNLPVHVSANQIDESESAYQYIQILEKDGARYLRFNEAFADQSMEYSDTPFTDRYWDTVYPLPNLSRAEKPRVLILGLATGAIARGIIETRPEGSVSVTGVEIDKRVIDFGKEYFSLEQLGDKIEIHVEDARTFLERTDEKYDMILADAYSNQLYIPFHMATDEFFALAKSRLEPGGILVANVNAPTRDSLLLTSIAKTIGKHFPHMDAYHVPQSWNRVIVASDESIDWEGAKKRIPEVLETVYEQVLSTRGKIDDSGGMLFTDDRAPVEMLTDSMIFDAYREAAQG